MKNVVSEGEISSKREFLQVLSSVYNPLRVFSPTLTTLKKLFQKICMMKINWDNVLPETIIAEWQNILENVNVMNSLKLERHYSKLFDLKDVEITELHGFSDASLKAYAAVICIRFKLKDDSYCTNFVASKTKISPVARKNLLIPKLELIACVLLNQLVFSVYSSLKFTCRDMKPFCWTDSLDCLFWIHNTKKNWKQFIQTRILKIRDTLEGTSWLFCPGVQNPVDIPTRGSCLKDDDNKEFWLDRPAFL